MGRSARAARETDEKGRGSSTLWHEVEAIFAIAGACYLAISFLTYAPGKSGGNAGGPVGHVLADLFVQAFGLAAFLVPACIALVAVLVLRGVPIALSLTRGGALTAQLLLIATTLSLVRGPGREASAGGWLGGFLAFELRGLFSTLGAVMIVATGLLLTAMIATGSSLIGGVRAAGQRAATARSALGSAVARWRPRRLFAEPETDDGLPARARRDNGARDRDTRDDDLREREPREREGREREGKKGRLPAPPPILLNEPDPRPEKKTKEPKPLKQEEFHFAPGAAFELPPASFLDAPVDTGVHIDEEALIASSRILRDRSSPTSASTGRSSPSVPVPVITTFEFEPAPGVKVNRIVNLADDLSMALRALSVRILAPIPGKPVVGIEVSNPRREKVFLREIIMSDAVPALGVEADARARQGHDGQHARRRPRASMPHLLIAGATGTGKSVSLNAMIMSILYKATPARRALHHDRPEDARALDLRGHPAPAGAGRHRSEEGRVRAHQRHAARWTTRYRCCTRRASATSTATTACSRARRREKRAGVIELTTPEDAEDEDRTAPAEPAPPASRSSTSTCRASSIIIDELADLMMTVGARRRGVDHPPGAEGARRRHPPRSSRRSGRRSTSSPASSRRTSRRASPSR